MYKSLVFLYIKLYIYVYTNLYLHTQRYLYICMFITAQSTTHCQQQ